MCALVRRRGDRNLPDPRRQRLRNLQLRPLFQCVGAGPRHRRHARRSVPFVASPMHKQAFDLRTGQCLDDAAVRVPTYDVQVTDGAGARRPAARRVRDRARQPPSTGFRIGVTAARKVDEQVSPAGAARRRRSSGRRRCRWTRTRSTTPQLRAATDEVLSRPVDMFLATTGIGMKAWFAAAERWGHAADDLLAALGRRPRSWPAGPRASVPCAAGGCASCGRRSRSASRTCCEHLRGRDLTGHADRRAGARAVAVDGRARAAAAGRGRDHGDRLPGGRRRRPGADVQADRPDRRPRARRRHLHLRPGRGRADGRRRLDRPPRRA